MNKKQCRNCGQDYDWSRGHLYCSIACKEAFTTPPPRDCEICGKSFSPTKGNPQARYCSSKCRGEGRRVVFPRQCEVCKNVFQPKDRDIKCCSLVCRNKLLSEIIKSQKPLAERTCKVCGKHFQIRPSRIGYGSGTGEYCSRECSAKKSVAKRVAVPCAHCGKTFEKPPKRFTKTKTHYCSIACKHEHIKAEREPVKCPECGKVFQDKKARKRRFCSASCKGIYMIKTGAFGSTPTTIEKAIDEVLREMGIIYVPQFPIGKYVCDFYIPASNLVVECDGDYWHNRPEMVKKDRRKDAFLTRKGYKILRLPEYKIRNHIESCAKEIKERVFL